MKKIDRRGKLQEIPFTFKETADGKVFIYWHGRQVKALKNGTAEKFLQGLTDENAQLRMARVTGNFKRGNE
ncbi:MAG TPA: hypothetical protein PLI15_03920 [Anaerolineales bacterium]|nr:hypothetical protein [Anaerolineales bacterium]